MTRRSKLLARVRNNPRDVRYSDLVLLAEAHGFALDRAEGTSHRVYKHARVRKLLNLQPRADGKARPYQVRDFLRMVDEYGLTMENEG